MKSVYVLLLILGALSSARIVSAEEIVLRLVDVRSGGGVKGCYVGLSGGPERGPGQFHWLRYIWPSHEPPQTPNEEPATPADGRVRFRITEPLPKFVALDIGYVECRVCDGSRVFSGEEILRTGVMGDMSSGIDKIANSCRPNLNKLEKIKAKPGEIVISVRKTSFWERFQD